MNPESPEICALSAQRGEAAPDTTTSADKRQELEDWVESMEATTTILIYAPDNVEHKRNLRLLLRKCARMFDIPVSGQD